MTTDDILRMAREAGLLGLDAEGRLARFAALVAAAEREACAIAGGAASDVGLNVAAAIRARGQQEPEDDNPSF